MAEIFSEKEAMSQSSDRALLGACAALLFIAHFAAGELRPLPFQEVPISRAAEAFRAMQQSRHIGKLVVVMDADGAETLPIVRSSKTIGTSSIFQPRRHAIWVTSIWKA